jgi:hypothetical protein
MRRHAEALVGRPYSSAPLNGGPDLAEKFVVDLGSFDCVTFVETVTALARTSSASGFAKELRALRYRNAEIGWARRLHYFSDWIRVNTRRGALRDRTKGPGARVIEARLDCVPGLAGRTTKLTIAPKRAASLAASRIEDGSVVAFASTRSRLDYFHVGLLFRPETEPESRLDELTLMHASRTAGEVVKEPFVTFLKRHRMRGFTFATVQAMKRRSR